MHKNKTSLAVLDITLIATMTAVLEVSKRVLDAIPNVELISVLFIVFTLCLGVKKTLISSVAFAITECAVFGISTWTITYFYVWPILVLATYGFRRANSKIVFSILSAFFGLFFGMLCSLVTLFIGGLKLAISWWAAGITYDIVHCISNFVICLVLFDPLVFALKELTKKYSI